ncbi:MAG TPA: hypothetical protein VK806_03550 [Bacteroidia bacterium]|jgi:hypothetical protein|nr:hypothetical protein [Bacteroidia bacterium]
MYTDSSIISPVIEKEDIVSLHFPDHEVLESLEDIKQRRIDAERATFLGNGYLSKVTIHFKDVEGFKKVETTIWEVTETKIALKNGIGIPLHRVIKVDAPKESLKYPNI